MARLVIGTSKAKTVPAVVRDKSPTYYREFGLDANGCLGVNITSSVKPNFSGVQDVADYVFYNAYKNNTGITGEISMPDLYDVRGGYSFYGAFEGCSGITSVSIGIHSSGTTNTNQPYSTFQRAFLGCVNNTSVSMSNLTTVGNENYAGLTSFFQGAFANNTNLVSVNIPLLEKVIGESCCLQMFMGDTSIKNIDLSKLYWVGGKNVCAQMFGGCSGLETADLGALDRINGQSGCASMFTGCTSLISLNIKSLTRVNGVSGAYRLVYGCSSLPTLAFQSLNYIAANGVNQLCTNCTSLQSLWFYALDTNSFASSTSQFNRMLENCSNVTVHFPIRVQSTIGSWADVTGGFNGANTTVLFDIVTTLTGADGNTYTRKEKESTSTATAWIYNDTLYYTSGVSNHVAGVHEPSVGDNIYSDSACSIVATTVSAIA